VSPRHDATAPRARPDGGAGASRGRAASGTRRPEPTLVAAVRSRLSDGDPGDLPAVVREYAGVIGRDEHAGLVAAVRAEIWGAGPLQELLERPGVTDVLVNGTRVWCDRGSGVEPADVDLGTEADVRALAVRLAAAGGQRLDDACPVVDARLPDGTRLHAVLPPVADGGPLLSLRVLRPTAFTLAELEAVGTVDATVANVLRALVRERANVVVSGATGTGKTTLLGSLLSLVPERERIVCIEEAPEIRARHPHVVRLVTRRPNVEGAGGVGLAELVRQALRMRPDRLVLGECRGGEIGDVLGAFNTGHDGGCTTLHANAVEDVPARLEALGALAGLDRRAVVAQAAAALDAVVHLRREGGRRFVAQVGAVERTDHGLVVEPVLVCGPDGVRAVAASWPRFAERWRVPVGIA